MNHYYEDYSWKGGKPLGKRILDSSQLFKTPLAYRIALDPYNKRISIEQYARGSFTKVVYDSIFLDFRKLNPLEQTAWLRELWREEETSATHLIRDHYDRLVLMETSYFESGRCRLCSIASIHGVPLSTHRMFYRELGDSFNGVILYDSLGKPVMLKEYEVDGDSGEFSQLMREEWDMEAIHGNDYICKEWKELSCSSGNGLIESALHSSRHSP